jgi:RNA polymerase sigma-70 factor (ECF subfamily)
MHHMAGARAWGWSGLLVMHDPDELLAAMRRGDDNAFRQVAKTEIDGLYALALGVLGNHEDAEDACQEVFLKLLRFAPRLSPGTSLRAWLRRVCLNHCLDQCRKRRPRRRAELLEFAGPKSALATPQQQAEEAELQSALRRALVQLSDRQRAVFVLRHFSDCPLKEIAEQLRCSEGSVKAHLSRAVSKLRVLLSDLREGREV